MRLWAVSSRLSTLLLAERGTGNRAVCHTCTHEIPASEKNVGKIQNVLHDYVLSCRVGVL